MLARVNPSRTLTWRRLLQAHASGFLEWVDFTGKRFQVFDRLAEALERLLLDWFSLMGQRSRRLSHVRALPRCCPRVFSRGDNLFTMSPSSPRPMLPSTSSKGIAGFHTFSMN